MNYREALFHYNLYRHQLVYPCKPPARNVNIWLLFSTDLRNNSKATLVLAPRWKRIDLSNTVETLKKRTIRARQCNVDFASIFH